MPVISTPAPMRSMPFGVSRFNSQIQSGFLVPQHNYGTDVFTPSAALKSAATKTPQFSGRQATEAAQKNFLKGPEMKSVVEKDPVDPFVGDGVPAPLLEKTGMNEAEFVEGLNQFATSVQDTYLEHSDNNKEREKGDDEVKKISKSGNGNGFDALKIQYRGKGNVGWVFETTAGDKKFAIKIYRCNSDMSYEETASGAYFTAVPTSNMSALYFAHPSRTRKLADGRVIPSGWTIMQEINKNSKLNPGKSLEDQGYYPKDDHAGNFGGENNDILLDHGAGIIKY